MFGGSGVLTAEAVSRGAEQALVFDRDSKAVRQCTDLMKQLGISRQVRVRRGTVPNCLPTAASYDIIFVDPPYKVDATATLERLADLCEGVVVLEHRLETPRPNGLTLVDERKYGETRLSFFRREAVPQSDGS